MPHFFNADLSHLVRLMNKQKKAPNATSVISQFPELKTAEQPSFLASYAHTRKAVRKMTRSTFSLGSFSAPNDQIHT
jgi:hypothetical protein